MLAKLNRILKYFIIIGFIVLVLLSVYYKYDSCSKCEFELKEDKYDAEEFMGIYAE